MKNSLKAISIMVIILVAVVELPYWTGVFANTIPSIPFPSSHSVGALWVIGFVVLALVGVPVFLLISLTISIKRTFDAKDQKKIENEIYDYDD